MIRTKQTCYSSTEKDKFPFDEVMIFWTDSGDTTDTEEILLRKLIPVSSLEAMTNRKEIFYLKYFLCFCKSKN